MSKTVDCKPYEAEAVFEGAAPLALGGSLGAFLAAPAQLLSKLRTLRRHRLAMHELHQLDDRMLKDIGVNRAEIPGVALRGREIF